MQEQTYREDYLSTFTIESLAYHLFIAMYDQEPYDEEAGRLSEFLRQALRNADVEVGD